MKGIEVDFHHYHYTFSNAELVKFGSPHFSDKEIGENLSSNLFKGVAKKYETSHVFNRSQVICANEAFPEAAISDPLSDLEIWDEWSSGRRVFPYIGRFSRLGITGQETKTSASSSIGVLGEIFAGIFSQAYIAPQLIVRVIRRWPDFIFHSGSGIYSFVESKAFAALGKSYRNDLRGRIPGQLLRECLVAASRQFNADAFLKIWGAFTGIREIKPDIRIEVTFLELDIPKNRRTYQTTRLLPQPVIEGVAQRAIAQAAVTLSTEELESFKVKPEKSKKRKKTSRRQDELYFREEVEKKLEIRAKAEVEGILANNADEIAITTSIESLFKEISKRISMCLLPPAQEGERFFSAKETSLEGTFAELRQVGGQFLYGASLSLEQDQNFTATWTPTWDSANTEYTIIGEDPAWRCGGMVIVLSSRDLSYETFHL